MKKSHKIIYWIATIWLALAMTSSGIVQLLKIDSEIAFILRLGYPGYFLTILAVWKLLGVIAILIPRSPLLKEWAYAGFFFAMTGALVSHLAMHSPAKEMFGSILSIILIVTSWYFRPVNRKILLPNQ